MFIAKALYATSPSNPPYAFDAVLPIIDLIVDSEYKKLKLFTTKFLSIKVIIIIIPNIVQPHKNVSNIFE